MLKVRLVAKEIWAKPLALGGKTEKSQLDEYRICCLLEQVDGRRWRVSVQMRGHGVATLGEKFSLGTKTVNTKERDDLAKAKELALKHVVSEARIAALKYCGIDKQVKLFAGIKWEDGLTFRLR